MVDRRWWLLRCRTCTWVIGNWISNVFTYILNFHDHPYRDHKQGCALSESVWWVTAGVYVIRRRVRLTPVPHPHWISDGYETRTAMAVDDFQLLSIRQNPWQNQSCCCLFLSDFLFRTMRRTSPEGIHWPISQKEIVWRIGAARQSMSTTCPVAYPSSWLSGWVKLFPQYTTELEEFRMTEANPSSDDRDQTFISPYIYIWLKRGRSGKFTRWPFDSEPICLNGTIITNNYKLP